MRAPPRWPLVRETSILIAALYPLWGKAGMAQEQGETLPSWQACPFRRHPVIGQYPRAEEQHAPHHAVHHLHDRWGDLGPQVGQEPQQQHEPQGATPAEARLGPQRSAWIMPQFSPEQRHAIMAAVDALLLQISARVPLSQTAAGTVLVPLHPLLDLLGLDLLLEATALTLLRPQASLVAEGVTALMVPLGEAFALLPWSRQFPEALAPVLQIVAVRTAAETRSASIPSAPMRARRPQPKRTTARARGVRSRADHAPQETPHQ